jgi:hypothetical protein
MHKTRRSVEPLAETLLEPINKAPAHYIAIRLADFAEGPISLTSSLSAGRVQFVDIGRWGYVKPRCGNLVMHDAETRTVQGILDAIGREDGLAPRTIAHVKHVLGGMFRFAIAQGHLPKGAISPVTFTEMTAIPDCDGRAHSLEETVLMLSILPSVSRGR